MKSVNQALKTAIRTALMGVGYDIYANIVPASASDTYILLSDVASTDAGTMQSSDTDTTLQIGIFSKANIANGGQTVEDIAEAVYAAIYPNPQSVLTIPGFQNTRIALVNDTTQSLGLSAFIMINRILIFRFNLFHLT